MSEESLMGGEPPKEEIVTENAAEENQYSEVEKEAMEFGWKPDFSKDDPNYRGAGAFLQYKKERDKFTSEISGLKDGIKNLTDGFADLTKRQQDAHKKELEEIKAQAKTDLDFDKYEEAQKQLQQIEDQSGTEGKEPEKKGSEPDFVATFRTSNPIIDATSETFNADFNMLVETRVNQAAQQMVAQGKEITPELGRKILEREFTNAKQAMPHIFNDENKRKAPKANDPAGKGKSSANIDSLPKDIKEMYNFINKNQSKKAADNFLARLQENTDA